MTILYCTPTGWSPGRKGFAGAACAADSEYHVLVPSEAWSHSCSRGAAPRAPTRSRPWASPRSTSASALTAQGVRYAVLAQVGTLEATPAFRLSAPSLEGLHQRLSSRW